MLDLQQVLASLAAGRREPKEQGLIEGLAGDGSHSQRKAAMRGGGGSRPVNVGATAAACGPLTRNTPTGARPGAVAGA